MGFEKAKRPETGAPDQVRWFFFSVTIGTSLLTIGYDSVVGLAMEKSGDFRKGGVRMPDSAFSPTTAGQWKKHLDTLLEWFQGKTDSGGPTAVAHQRYFGYADAETLKDSDKSEPNGQCVALIKKYVPEIGPTTGWKPGSRVKDIKPGIIPKGSVIATFWNGAYPSDRSSGKHAAFYLEHDDKGIKVVEQWSGATPKAAAKTRGGGVIKFKGIKLPEDQTGDSPHMSNIGEYHYLVLDNR